MILPGVILPLRETEPHRPEAPEEARSSLSGGI